MGAALRVVLIAGEASGDALGAALIEGLRDLAPGLIAEGVAGPLMRGRGARTWFPMDELSVMGLAEVLPKYRHLRRRMIEVADRIIADPPGALVTIDAPDFCLRVAARVKAARPDLPVIHYVAPSVWAWRPGRAARLRGKVDRVLALLPFEPPLIEAAGVPCTFVGHPVVTRPAPDPAEAAAYRAARGPGPLLTVLPGSRRGEVARLAPIFGAALRRLARRRPGLRVVVPAAPATAAMLPAALDGWPGAPEILAPDGPKALAFAASDAALAASGTVSLELAQAGLPAVIGYDVHPVTRVILRRLLRVGTVTLVNLVSGTRAVPELLGRDCRPGPIAEALDAVLSGDPTGQRAAYALTMARLGAGGEPPGLRAARAVLGTLYSPRIS